MSGFDNRDRQAVNREYGSAIDWRYQTVRHHEYNDKNSSTDIQSHVQVDLDKLLES